jgi:hypothetical protein
MNKYISINNNHHHHFRLLYFNIFDILIVTIFIYTGLKMINCRNQKKKLNDLFV